jgi:hypothetical protein
VVENTFIFMEDIESTEDNSAGTGTFFLMLTVRDFINVIVF